MDDFELRDVQSKSAEPRDKQAERVLRYIRIVCTHSYIIMQASKRDAVVWLSYTSVAQGNSLKAI